MIVKRALAITIVLVTGALSDNGKILLPEIQILIAKKKRIFKTQKKQQNAEKNVLKPDGPPFIFWANQRPR